MKPMSLKVKNNKCKKAATEVINNAAVKAAWSAIGLSSIPAARVKAGHSNGHKRGTGRNKPIIRDSCTTGGVVPALSMWRSAASTKCSSAKRSRIY